MDAFFNTFLEGFWHILDLQGADHIVFLLALCAIYEFRDWKGVLLMVTAFTIGHAITLAVAGLDLVRVKSNMIEFLIPVTILITAIWNFFKKGKSVSWISYLITLCFGFIHGLGFSNYFRMVGDETKIVRDLLAFNLGVEAGQIPIVLAILFCGYLATQFFKSSQKEWSRLLSGMAIGASLIMISDTWPW